MIHDAVIREKYSAIGNTVAENCDDRRAIYKIYGKLVELLTSHTHSQGTIAAYGLTLLAGYGDWPLIRALEHKDEMVRYRAAFALGKMGKYGRNGIPALTKALNDPDDWVRDAVGDALKAIQKDGNV